MACASTLHRQTLDLNVMAHPSVKHYLERFANQYSPLAKLINHPDPQLGVEHTPAEIAQQPHLWRQTIRIVREQAPALRRFLEDAHLFDRADTAHVILTGAGTSDYVGLSLADLFRVNFRTPSINWSTTRITASPDTYINAHHRYLILHFARSGNSPESCAVLRMGLRDYPDTTRHIVVTCNREGELAKMAFENTDKVFAILLPEESNDKGLAMTSSYSSMVIAGQAIANIDTLDTYTDMVERMACSAEYFMDTHAQTIFDLADPTMARAFYLGNRDLLGAANESALKVQELTMGKLIAKAEDTLTFRHGPISAVDTNTMVCFFLSEDNLTLRYELDVLNQYESAFNQLGVTSVAVGSNHREKVGDSSAHFLPYDPDHQWNIPSLYQVNLAVLFGQLFGMFASYRREINVDNPAQGKALYSRIVQGVRLHER